MNKQTVSWASTLLAPFLAFSAAGRVSAQIIPVVQESGRITVSVDGLGTTAASGQIQVAKPNAGATVRAAYMSACSHALNGNNVIANGDITIAGQPVTWSRAVFNNAGSTVNFFHNVFGNVTNIVKPIIDAAAPGTINLTVAESRSVTINGSILAVVFDDATAANSTCILLFGGQNTNGDRFVITLAEPINPNLPGVKADMGLGIGHGFQGATGSPMVSQITVNGTRLTSSAGGEDDGGTANGALITVGGLGDSNANPPDPFAGSTNFRTDDELYNFLPFVTSTTTQITVDTINPSDDDDVFFGYFVTSVPAAIGESILLTPVSATLVVGNQHTLTARVQDDNNSPVVGRTVNFEITSGPNVGRTGSGATGVNGQATFSYVGNAVGTDTAIARMTNSRGQPQSSNTAEVIWVTGNRRPDCTAPPFVAGLNNALLTFQVTGSDVDVGDSVELSIVGSLPAGASMTPALPLNGNPVSSTFNWIPTFAQIGGHDVVFRVRDRGGLIRDCLVRIEVRSECLLLLAAGSGRYQIGTNDYLLVNPGLLFFVAPTVEASVPILNIPNWVELQGVHVYAQVIMFNDYAFPQDPIKVSNGLDITLGGGHGASYGTHSGIQLQTRELTVLGGRIVCAFQMVP